MYFSIPIYFHEILPRHNFKLDDKITWTLHPCQASKTQTSASVMCGNLSMALGSNLGMLRVNQVTVDQVKLLGSSDSARPCSNTRKYGLRLVLQRRMSSANRF